MRVSVAIAVACLGLIGLSVADESQASIRKQTNIPAQGLGPALQLLAKERSFQIVYVSEEISDRRTEGVSGELTIGEALTRLLNGTGLTYRYLDENTVTVLPLATTSSAESASSAFDSATHTISTPQAFSNRATPDPAKKAGFWDRFRLAQNDQSSSSRTSDSNEQEEDSPQNADKSSERTIDEVIVIGSHIRGIENKTVPVTILDRAYIESTGIATTTGLMESVPQNFALVSQAGVFVPGSTGGRSQGASINLRGLGQGTSLILLNGRRLASGFSGLATDISALPLSAMQRVEVLTDGASALYGSDAIGGVVNFVLLSDYEGAETRVRSGWADGGLNEYRVSHTLGNAWDSGNALASAEYYHRDLLPASERDFVPPTSVIGSLNPEDDNYSVLLSGRQDLTSNVSLFGDGLLTNRETFNNGGSTLGHERYGATDRQVSATVGLDWDILPTWQVELSGGYASATSDQNWIRDAQINAGLGAFLLGVDFEIEYARLKTDGTLFTLPGGEVHAALGTDWRSETLSSFGAYESGVVGLRQDLSQSVHSAFAELYVPIIGEANRLPGIRQFDLSIAGRYEKYSTFGNSIDPQVGLMWEPMDGVRIRASHGTSYRAPTLVDYDQSSNAALIQTAADPGVGGTTRQLRVQGAVGSDELTAQESESTSIGIDFSPTFADGLRLGMNYYTIRYEGQISATPSASILLGNAAAFGSLVIRNPTAAQVNQYADYGRLGQGFFVCSPTCVQNGAFDPATVQVIVDQRRRNLARTETSGLDVSAQYEFNLSDARAHIGLDGTYIFEFRKRVTAVSADLETVNTIYNPPQLKVRGNVGLETASWSGNVFVNYVDSYTDNRLPATLRDVDSYTTVDTRLAYDFQSQGIFSNVTLALSAQNLFNEDPPRTSINTLSSDMGFDPTNANPIGRLIAIELSKQW